MYVHEGEEQLIIEILFLRKITVPPPFAHGLAADSGWAARPLEHSRSDVFEASRSCSLPGPHSWSCYCDSAEAAASAGSALAARIADD